MTTTETEPATPPAAPAPAPAPAPARKTSIRRLLRHFTMQLVPVTAGILLALLIDDLRESRRQDELVAEAHAAIAAEIADNAKQLDNSLPTLDSVEAELNGMLAMIDEILANGTTERICCSFGLVPPRLNRASFESAERTGALSYMDYEHVQRYAGLYAGQDAISAGFTDLLRRFPTLGSVGEALQSQDRAARGDDLKRGRGVIAEFLIAIRAHRVMANGLRDRYGTMPCYLDDCPEPAAASSP